jgi:hypothetical protein
MNWERRYNDLVEFKRAHGADSLPSKQEDHQLQAWVWFQRSEFRNGNMAADRIAKLDEIGVLMAIRDETVLIKSTKESRPEAKWNMRYNELAGFKREFGHLTVSRITHPELSTGHIISLTCLELVNFLMTKLLNSMNWGLFGTAWKRNGTRDIHSYYSSSKNTAIVTSLQNMSQIRILQLGLITYE